ncbi:O-antigen/teichoic acid export membrane protein [Massilia sp. UYP11]
MKLRLARNAWSNLLGAAVPALVMLATVPLVVRGLGEAGYGVYSLVTAIVGYFAVMDINLTAGSVKYIAQHRANGDARQVAETLSFGLATYAAIGLVGALGIYLCAAWLVDAVFAVPAALRPEAGATLQLAALAFLCGQLQSYLNSVPQSLMRYDISGRLEMAFGALVPLATVGVLALGFGLFEVILLRVVASSLHALLLWRAIRRLLPHWRWRWPAAGVRAALLRFSGWTFLSRFAALSYAHADKLVIGALVGVAGLAYFTVAATLANRVLGLSFRLSAVAFPAASALAARGELARLDAVYLKATRYVVYLNAAILLLLAVFAYPILLYWMDAAFARHGAAILALMALAQFVDSLTSLPSLVNDGMGHPRVSGLFAVVRALAGLGAVYAGVAAWGIVGAAWGHLAASLLCATAFLAYVHGRTVPTPLRRLLVHGYAPGLAGIALVAVAAGAAETLLDDSLRAFLAILAATVLLLALHGTLFVLERGDRDLAWARLKTRRQPVRARAG